MTMVTFTIVALLASLKSQGSGSNFAGALSARTKAWELISRHVYGESPRGRSIWREHIIASPPGPPFRFSLFLSTFALLSEGGRNVVVWMDTPTVGQKDYQRIDRGWLANPIPTIRHEVHELLPCGECNEQISLENSIRSPS